MKRYSPMVYGLLYEMVKSPEDARDLTQESFVKAFTQLDYFRESARFSTWLYRIAYNTGIDAIRKTRRKRQMPLDEVPEKHFSHTPSQYEGVGETLEAAIEQLSVSQRSVVTLHYQQGMTLKEAAEVMSCAESTARVHLFRGLKRLRQLLPSEYQEY